MASETPENTPQDGQVQPPIISDYAGGGFTIGGAFTKGGVLITGAEGTGFSITPWAVDDADKIDAASLAPLYQTPELPNLTLRQGANRGGQKDVIAKRFTRNARSPPLITISKP